MAWSLEQLEAEYSKAAAEVTRLDLQHTIVQQDLSALYNALDEARERADELKRELVIKKGAARRPGEGR